MFTGGLQKAHRFSQAHTKSRDVLRGSFDVCGGESRRVFFRGFEFQWLEDPQSLKRNPTIWATCLKPIRVDDPVSKGRSQPEIAVEFRLLNPVHGCGFTIFVPDFDCDSFGFLSF